MTVIKLVAGKEHTVKVGAKEKHITVRPGEVRYEPFLRDAPDIPITPSKPFTYEEWSRARPKPTVEDVIDMVEGVRGRREIGFKPTFSNLISLLRKYRK